MPSWTSELADFERLVVGQAYSKRQAAGGMSVTAPVQSRDWGGIVRFRNGLALFITLDKGADRYAKQHRYNDRFEYDLVYWDSRASHDKSSSQVQQMRRPDCTVVAFARLREKSHSRTLPFIFLGRLEFVDYWGERPVHFTWRLKEFPSGLSGSSDLVQLANWRPAAEIPSTQTSRADPHHSQLAAYDGGGISEGAKTRIVVNRYERDPRAKSACIHAHGSKCMVCGFDFEAAYGRLGASFIFVHHRIPIALRAQGGEYELDPVRDLVPICGNCHAMVHRRVEGDIFSSGPPGLSYQSASRLLELRRLALGVDESIRDDEEG